MAFFDVQANMVAMLHYQHRMYTSELGKSHRTLSKLYKKLEKAERGLSTWKCNGLTRKDKKKMQWDRATTKSLVKDAEASQALLHDYLRQCNDLIASYSPQFYQSPAAVWQTPLSPTATSFAPSSPAPPTPWTAGPFEERPAWNPQGPQYWDLSMLRERQASPFMGSADSGFYEPAGRGVSNNNSGTTLEPVTSNSSRVSGPSNRSSFSEKDALPELVTPSSPAKVGAEGPASPHQRRYSENAIQMIESRLGIGKVKRTASETRLSKEE